MDSGISGLIRTIFHILLLWFVNALSLALASWVLPGMDFRAVDGTPGWRLILATSVVLSVVNLVVRPIVLRLAMPLGWVTTLLIGYLVNAVILWIAAWMVPGFEVSIWAGLIGGIVIAFFNTVLIDILHMEEEDSWHQKRIEERARKEPFDHADLPGRGLMMVEIDGLSYWHIKKAIDDGLMPTMKEMMEEDGYRLSRVECGLPSMTSACQAGIMFGDNHDIPAYRWYDKSRQKLYVSASDAAELNDRYAHGQGLMRQGSSIMNMMDGDAEKSMFTMSNMFEGSREEKKRRAKDMELLCLNPHFVSRAFAMFTVSLGRELWEGWRQKQKGVEPRLNRLKEWYPFVRAGMCTFMRIISANLAILDMMRGAPSIYMLYLGYDEVAHHSGPWTSDAFGDLKRLDRVFARLRRVIDERAPRPYDLIILSDHGQSFGATFRQRYGLSIKDFIEQQLPTGTTVATAIGGDRGGMALRGMAGELENVQASDDTSAISRALAEQGQKLAERAMDEAGMTELALDASVTAYGSGNAAQVYFDVYPRKILLSELNQLFPGMVEALVAHEGIGLVVGYGDDGTAVAMGKGGTRNVHTGEVEGEDPLLPYAPASGEGSCSVDTRAWQVKRVMDFPSAGDLWLISTVYPDGTVAALEELIGSHGGMGGPQTDAFIFHPPRVEVPETRASIDVFHILDRYRPHLEPESPTATDAPSAADRG